MKRATIRSVLRTSPGLAGEKMAQSAGSDVRFEHRLALFVEAGDDGVVLFETDKQARQWRLVVVAVFEVLPRLLQGKPRQLLDAAQPTDPVFELSFAMPPQQCPVMRLAFAKIALQRLPDALGQRLFDLWEFVLHLGSPRRPRAAYSRICSSYISASSWL